MSDAAWLTGWAVTFVQLTVVVASPLYGLVADWSGHYHTGCLTET